MDDINWKEANKSEIVGALKALSLCDSVHNEKAVESVRQLLRVAADIISYSGGVKTYSLLIDDTANQSPKKVPAIKAVRRVTGMSLKDAKDLVERAPTTVIDGLSHSQLQTFRREFINEGITVVVKEEIR